MIKDPFQEMADALDLIRFEMQRLQRTSMTTDDGAKLHGTLTKAVGQMERAAREAPTNLEAMLRDDRGKLVDEIARGSSEAVDAAMTDLRRQFDEERLKYAQAAGEARRAAWRSFGGFWVWALCLLATGAFLGLLTASIIETGRTLFSVEQMVRYGCGKPPVGGQIVEYDNGSSSCGFWIVDPELAEWRRERDREG